MDIAYIRNMRARLFQARMGLEKCFAPFYTISSLHFHFTPPENIKKPKVFKGYKMMTLITAINRLTKFWAKKGNFLTYKSVIQINLKIAINLLWISTSFRKWEHSINSIKILYNIKWQQLLLMLSKHVEQSAWKTIS